MVLIIAEIGVNHNGDINKAKKLIEIASEAGADVVKFQTFNSEDLSTNYAPLAEYQEQNSPELKDQSNLLKKLELTEADHFILKKYAEKFDIEFLSTAFTVQSVDFLSRLGLRRWKIPSGEINNIKLLEKIALLNQPIIISTGMSCLGEIETAINTLTSKNLNKEKITILHCNTAYPTPLEDVNLNVIKTLRSSFGVNVGYSDHTLGIEVSTAAVALGSSVIEKHITLDRNLPGPDHKASLEPDEFKNLIKSIRNVTIALGSKIKQPTKSEEININIARKSIVASKFIKTGEIFTEENLTSKRPATGVPPNLMYLILGKKSNRNYNIDEQIEIL